MLRMLRMLLLYYAKNNKAYLYYYKYHIYITIIIYIPIHILYRKYYGIHHIVSYCILKISLFSTPSNPPI